eukprot:7786341-Pyramimonas_sp.AAC.1
MSKVPRAAKTIQKRVSEVREQSMPSTARSDLVATITPEGQFGPAAISLRALPRLRSPRQFGGPRRTVAG